MPGNHLDLMTMPVWVRNGTVAGLLAFVVTLSANLVILLLAPAQLCKIGPLIIPGVMFGAFLVFILLAAVAGFVTGRGPRVNPDAAWTGLLVGAISGCALLIVIPFMPALSHRTQALSSTCPIVVGRGGSFAFNIGSTPPPGFVEPTPPPGFFQSPPPGAFGPPSGTFGPPSGILGAILSAVGAAFDILLGLGIAAGVATLGGLVGGATRRSIG